VFGDERLIAYRQTLDPNRPALTPFNPTP